MLRVVGRGLYRSGSSWVCQGEHNITVSCLRARFSCSPAPLTCWGTVGAGLSAPQAEDRRQHGDGDEAAAHSGRGGTQGEALSRAQALGRFGQA